jgi:hypothetical protein
MILVDMFIAAYFSVLRATQSIKLIIKPSVVTVYSSGIELLPWSGKQTHYYSIRRKQQLGYIARIFYVQNLSLLYLLPQVVSGYETKYFSALCHKCIHHSSAYYSGWYLTLSCLFCMKLGTFLVAYISGLFHSHQFGLLPFGFFVTIFFAFCYNTCRVGKINLNILNELQYYYNLFKMLIKTDMCLKYQQFGNNSRK